jgi:hypothetical protein
MPDPVPPPIHDHYEAHWLKDLAPVFEDDADPADRDVVVAAARAIESEPSLLGLSSHLLTVASRPA